MIRARPEELSEEVVPVVEARLQEREVRKLIPVALKRLDPLAEAEASIGSLVRLEADLLVVAVYGRETGTLSLRLPESALTPEAVAALLREVPIPKNAILWRNPATLEPHASAAMDVAEA